MQNFVKKLMAVAVSILTVFQCVLPTYAEENTATPSLDDSAVVSHLNVEVKGDGEVTVQSGDDEHVVNKDESLTLDTVSGTQIHFDIKEQDNLFIKDFTLNEETVEDFEEGISKFEYDFTATESDATFVISFETESNTENTGVSDENQSAEDADVGELEESTDLVDESEVRDYDNDGDIDIDDFNIWMNQQTSTKNSISLFAARSGGNTFNDITGANIDGDALVAKARSWVGKLGYVNGSKHPNSGSIDCSGFVTWMFREYLGTMSIGSMQAGWDYNPSNYVGDRASYYDANSGPGMYTMGAWDSYTGHLYLDPYGIGSPNLMDVRAWDTLLRNGKTGTRLTSGVSSSSVTLCGNEPAEGFDSFNPGDIVIFYIDAGGTDTQSAIPHMGIYSGNGNFIHSSLATGGVAESPITSIHTGSDVDSVKSYRIFRVSEANGSLQITKASANPDITDGNDCYGSMEGAQYGLYSDASVTQKIGTFTIGSDGKSNVIEELKAATYYVKEVKAPKGYALDQTIYAVTVNAGDTTTRNFVDLPQSDPVVILLGKVDKATNANKPQGAASLSNAQFTINYYDGYYDDKTDFSALEATRTWVVKTDEDGYTRLSENYLVSGDELYTSSNGDTTLPLGTVTIEETKAPEGYLLNDELFIRQITSEGSAERVETYNQPVIPDDVILGNFTIRKIITNGNQSEIVTPEKGAEFVAIYKGYVEQYGSFEEAMKHTDEFGPNEWSTLVTDKNGVGTSGDLAYGTYIVKQTAGTAETDMLEETFEVTITEDGQSFEYTINNRPSDYYVKIVKKDADNGKIVSLNNASFQLTKVDDEGNPIANYTDNGQVRTDANGIVSVKSGLMWYNTFTTNAENRLSIIDHITNYEGTVHEDQGTVTIPLKLPSGNYVLTETNVPDGYLKGEQVEFALSKSNITETDQDGDAVVTLTYSDPKPTGRIELTKEFEDPDYIMHGSVTFDLIVTQDIVDPADGTVLYKAGDKYGTYELNTENNTIVIEGLPMGVGESHFKLVEATTYENYQLNTEEYAVDFVQADETTPIYTAEVTVENELIHIGTTALNADTNGKEFNSAKEITITDTVEYDGVLPGQEYTMHATLMNKAGEPVRNEDGSLVEGYKKFTPESESGTVNVKMSLDASQLGGQDFVVFESLLNTGVEGHENCEVAKHQDLTDEDQTITILPSEIGTTAKSENGTHEQQVTDGKITLTDTVSYDGLVAGMNYKLSGTLMNKETGEALIDADGKLVTSETEFTPEASSGTAEVEFTFDASSIEAGDSIVVFEKLYELHVDDGVTTEIEVATHEDLEDEGQTIDFIDIHTNASTENGSDEQQATDSEVTLTDTVTYEGLTVGEEYTVSGTLMNKETGEALIDADGNEITAETTFTPEEENGTVDVEFTFEMTGIEAGTDIVVFESLYHDGIEVAVHADIEDEDQTIHIIDVQTEAESQNGTHTAPTGSEVTITDHVSYTNLEVGKEYKVSGKLMNKETGEPLLDAEGNEITAETTFTPDEPNGIVDLEYTLDSTLLAGNEVVVFESLIHDGIEVASHADIEDENQTIKFKHFEILVNKVDEATGKNIVSNEFEFTMYEDEECTKEVVTKAGNTENGTALFDVEEGTWYIKETAAPQGYLLSDEVVKVEVKDNTMYVNDKAVETDEDYLYSIVYNNTLNPVVNTGESNNMMILLAVGLGIIIGIGFVLLKIRKEK